MKATMVYNNSKSKEGLVIEDFESKEGLVIEVTYYNLP